MNITDVGHLVSDADSGEDKMETGSRRTGKSAWEIAQQFTQAFQNDLELLNIKQPDIWCKATDHIQEQINLIRCIEEKEFTYRTTDGIYFDTSRLPDYGYLARLDVEGLQAGSRIDMGEKKHPTDFALWKFSPPNRQRQMEWDSPWGMGFPGWHIECSAMSEKYLGSYFDIHCGGEDHISVHHTNEIAQTQACRGTRLANFWMHGYFLQIDESRMAKSKGEFLRVQNLIDLGYDPLAYRFFTHSAVYRAKLNFTWEGLDSAAKSFERLRSIVYGWGEPGTPDENFVQQFKDQVNDDLNIPRAIATTWELARSELSDSTKKATVLVFDQILGLRLGEWRPKEETIPQEILALVEKRQQMRREKLWADADLLREQISNAGYEVEDTPLGPKVKIQKR
jgi:cysteinyl-tRNA synthetase